MAQFAYRGRDRSGRTVNGTISAATESEARQKLRLVGTTVKSLRAGEGNSPFQLFTVDAKGKKKLNLGQKKVTASELAVFTKQLSVMIDSGVAIVQALDMLAAQTPNERLKTVLGQVRGSVEAGAELGTALEKHPSVFDNLYVSLVRAGTAAGQLDVMMRRLSSYIEKSNKLKRQLVSALSYPAFVVAIAIVLTFVMLVFVVPMFAKNYADSGKELPGLTQLVIDLSNGLQNNIHFIAAFIVGGGYGFNRWKATPKGAYKWDEIMLKMPIFGDLVTKISIARFSSTMSTLIASGIAIIEAIDVCGRAANNLVIQKELQGIKEDVSRGKGLAVPMAKSPRFPPMVSGMVAIGEASGKLDTMLEKVAAFYEEEVDAAMAAALKMVEPAMFVLIGGIVGFILIAMYLPVFDLASTAGG